MSLTLSNYNHIIWDWNGTLLDDAWLCVEVMNDILRRRAMPPLSRSRYEEIFGFPVLDYYQLLEFDFEKEPFETVSTQFVEGYEARRTECRLRPEAEPVLRQAERLGIGQTIISSSQHRYLIDAVNQIGMAAMFDNLLGLDNLHANGKIDIAIRWMSTAGVEPAEAILVGDTLHDLEVADILGVTCCLIPSGHQSRSRLEAGGAAVIDTLTELLP